MHQANEIIEAEADSKLPVTIVSSNKSSNNLNPAEHSMELTKREGTDSKFRKIHQLNRHSNNSDHLIRSRSVDFSKPV